MNTPLLQTLFDQASSGQMAGGIMMILLFSSVGAVAAIAMAIAARRIFEGWYEKLYWSLLLFAIAAFYTGFAAWFQVPADAWRTELIGIAVFALIAVIGISSAYVLALGYFLHGLWDFAHSAFGTEIFGHAASDIPLGYDMFCLGFDFASAAYLAWWPKQWDSPARFNPSFWRPAA